MPTLEELAALYLAADTLSYSDNQAGSGLLNADFRCVTLLAHSLQTAALAAAAFPEDDELIVAALLHDCGWALPKPSESGLLTSNKDEDAVFIARHDAVGSAFLRSIGFSERTCRLVAGHVAAKRYLVTTEPEYAAKLSAGSRWTLVHQGGVMSSAEVACFEASPDASKCLQLRRWDEQAKVPGAVVPGWETHLARIKRVLT